uniref:ZP domain-containing protein n=1 Tax=Caenorhabditis japonica TaxID=281687 RepID=A0A8R1DN64_CAEJA
MNRLAIGLCLCFLAVTAIPVDNNVEGEPEIECGPTSITVNFNTRNAFEGHVYVKGLFDQQECRNDEGGRQVAGIELPFDTCNVARTRSLNPKGVFVTTTVVVSFHPQFVTKVDRAYRIQCFYMEADKTVSTQIEVSDLTTAFQTQVVPMPICKYEILNGGPTGEPVQFATIGQQVYHKWTCDSETVDTFCAVVHSCTVDDGNGDTVQILDENGCALDKFLLNNLEYPTDLMAGQEAHVYKYADRSQLFYQCQISITVKEPHEECARPTCSEPQGFGAVKQANQSAQFFRVLKKRSAPTQLENILDVRAELTTLEVLEGDLPASLRSSPQALVSSMENGEFGSNFCVSYAFVAVAPMVMGVALVFTVIVTLVCARINRPNKKVESAC